MIDIGTVLSKTNETVHGVQPHVFSIKIVKKDGSFRTISRARRWVKDADKSLELRKAMDQVRKSGTNYNDNDLILIHDLDEPLKPKKSISIHSIVEFNGQRVNH